MRILSDQPGELIALRVLADMLDAAKSTISEDLALIREACEQLELGRLETVAGAAGGVRFWPLPSRDRFAALLTSLKQEVNRRERLLPGGFVYLTDIVFSPRWSAQLGESFARLFFEAGADVVVTVETKGIPLALMTARALGLPLVTCRRNSRVTEGSSVSITYITGTSGQLETMTLAKRAMPAGSRVLFIDDFLRGGGTAKGMHDLMAEFDATIVGTGVFMATRRPQQKRIDDFVPLLWLDEADADAGKIQVEPNWRLVHARAMH